MHRYKSLISLVAAALVSALMFTVGLWLCARLWTWGQTLTPAQSRGLLLAGILLSLFFSVAGMWYVKKRRKVLAAD